MEDVCNHFAVPGCCGPNYDSSRPGKMCISHIAEIDDESAPDTDAKRLLFEGIGGRALDEDGNLLPPLQRSPPPDPAKTLSPLSLSHDAKLFVLEDNDIHVALAECHPMLSKQELQEGGRTRLYSRVYELGIAGAYAAYAAAHHKLPTSMDQFTPYLDASFHNVAALVSRLRGVDDPGLGEWTDLTITTDCTDDSGSLSEE